jgi:hypothetical protein
VDLRLVEVVVAVVAAILAFGLLDMPKEADLEDSGGLEDGSTVEVVVEDDADDEEDGPAPSASACPLPPSI